MQIRKFLLKFFYKIDIECAKRVIKEFFPESKIVEVYGNICEPWKIVLKVQIKKPKGNFTQQEIEKIVKKDFDKEIKMLGRLYDKKISKNIFVMFEYV